MSFSFLCNTHSLDLGPKIYIRLPLTNRRSISSKLSLAKAACKAHQRRENTLTTPTATTAAPTAFLEDFELGSVSESVSSPVSDPASFPELLDDESESVSSSGEGVVSHAW